VLASDHGDPKAVWAIFGPAVGWSFIGTGLYAWRRRPESRTGALMVLLGLAWFLFTLGRELAADLHVRAGDRRALGRRVPASRPELPLGPAGARARPCARDRRLPDLSAGARSRAAVRGSRGARLRRLPDQRAWRGAAPLERLQLTPVYACALLTFLLVTAARGGAGDAAWWAAFISTALLPFAFLGGLLRSHVSQLDAELRARLEELRASRARLVEAGDTERRRPSATCTTAPSRGWLRFRCCSVPHGRAQMPTASSRSCSTARWTSCRRACPSCASSRAASIRPC
jgi:hypothetical protein